MTTKTNSKMSLEDLRDALAEQQSAALYNELGAAYLAQNNVTEAEAAFLKAVQIDPEYIPVYRHMMMISAMKADALKALEWGALAVQAEPDNIDVKDKLVTVLANLTLPVFHPNVHWLIYECLRTEGVAAQPLVLCWLSMLRKSPDFGALYKKCKLKNYETFEKSFSKIGGYEALAGSYFLSGLQKLLVPDYEFEMFLTYLRRYLSARVNETLNGLDGLKQINLLQALSAYCYRTEYIFYVSAAEQKWLEDLRAKVEREPENASMFEVLLLSCYLPLHSLSNADEIDSCFGGVEEFDDYLQIQLLNHKEQHAARKKVSVLTAIDDDVSVKVQAQYETFPYPRWQVLAQNASSADYETFLGDDFPAQLKGDNAKILIAGCGTGQQALEHGIAFPKATVTAVDLSMTSLSYAQQKKQQFNIGNVTFHQGDILQLGAALKPEYELVVSTGVLHHMDDPEAGWQVLSGLVKPAGLMRIALYSEAARQFIVRGRAAIAAAGYGDDDAAIRNFRHERQASFKKDDLALMHHAEDFYSLSECRDMLFHVQEHRFDVTRLKAALDLCGLDFIKFEVGAHVQGLYREMFPDDLLMQNLTHWEVFEKKHPQTFMNMYRLWCKKR